VKYKIVCIAQVYNELRKGNLERFVKYVMPLVDALVVYDDASTDGSYEYLLKHTSHVIRGTRNDFLNEISHKQQLLDYALGLNPDFIFYLDADEVFTANAQTRLQELCTYCVENNIDGVSFHKLNLWRSHSWRRTDNAYDDGWFVHLWRVTPGMSFSPIKPGLHQPPYPRTLEKIERVEDVQVIHYGFASESALAHKYLVYKSHGQMGWALNRLLDETTLTLKKVARSDFPEGLWVDDDQPEKLSFTQALAYVERYRAEVFTPGVSVICLIYKSTKWLKFIYEQVLRYIDLHDKEFFFVANDANEEVLQYLREHYIPHYVWNNSEEQRNEWYINNVYRASNYGARMARGDYLLFINSDMAFTPGWFEYLLEKLNGQNCVTSRLVESGKMVSGEYGISRNFGRSIEEYDEDGFLKFAESVSEPSVRDGGLFMPLLIRKDDFWRVGGYPEGNIVPGSDLFNPLIAKKGKPCVSGDVVLMQKLQNIGIQHQTAFDSVVYHFQCGEMDEVKGGDQQQILPSIIICNDYLTGRMGEKTMWGFLLDSLPSSAGVDINVVGTAGNFAKNAHDYIRKCYPQSAIIVQNATFIDTVDQEHFTIAYLQDNLRGMGRPSKQQEQNLRDADILVTNSRLTAFSYPDFEFKIISIGVNPTLFRKMNKPVLRREFGFPDGKVGIFVGDFSEVKGWSKVREVVEKRKDIFWILVSKDTNTYQADNCRTYNRIHQNLLAKLLNCADFFIVGSPVETECLTAIEACMCEVPVVMQNTGIFADFTEEERAQVGIFGEDFEQAIDLIFTRSFSPRKVVIEKGLTIDGMTHHWVKVLEQAHLQVAIERAARRNRKSLKADWKQVRRGKHLRVRTFFVPRMRQKIRSVMRRARAFAQRKVLSAYRKLRRQY